MKLLSSALAFVMCILITHSLRMNEEEKEESDNQAGMSPNPQHGMSWLREITSGHPQPHSRKKRFIQFPKDSNIECKWSLNVPFDSFTYYKAKFQYALPIRIPIPEPLMATVGRRSLDQYQDPEQKQHIQHGDDVYAVSVRKRREARNERRSIYTYLTNALEKYGNNGHECLLRAICDVAEAPFEQGIFGELVNGLLTASVAGRPEDPSEEADYEKYLEAEEHGRSIGSCAQKYEHCKMSPLELIPYIIHTFS